MKRNWTTREINFLKCNFGKLKIESIAKKLDRTENAVLLKARRLKIGNTKQAQDEISLGELAALIKKDRRTLQYWIQKGALPAHKRITRNKRAFYFIKPEEFWNWAFENKEKLNFSKLQPNSIPPEPSWVNEERKQKKLFVETPYKCWTLGEINYLLEFRRKGYKHSEIAKKLKRSTESVEKKLSRLKQNLS